MGGDALEHRQESGQEARGQHRPTECKSVPLKTLPVLAELKTLLVGS